MRIHAYRETYLRKAMINLGDMFDCAVGEFGIGGREFSEMFSISSISKRLEKGEPKLLMGMSGTELAIEVIKETTGLIPEIDDIRQFSRTSDYWVGWAVCYYQWLRNISYADIFTVTNYDELLSLYKTLHEADISKFAEVMDSIRVERRPETNLKRIRSSYGVSQSELARDSGVSLRSIQMYEQRNKDINKSQSETIWNLASVLGCRMEDLLEPEWAMQ